MDLKSALQLGRARHRDGKHRINKWSPKPFQRLVSHWDGEDEITVWELQLTTVGWPMDAWELWDGEDSTE